MFFLLQVIVPASIPVSLVNSRLALSGEKSARVELDLDRQLPMGFHRTIGHWIHPQRNSVFSHEI